MEDEYLMEEKQRLGYRYCGHAADMRLAGEMDGTSDRSFHWLRL
jgi:hypothetical protein